MTKDRRAGSESELEEALSDPSSVFASPREVLEREGWTREQRRQVLEQWRQDAAGLAEATAENMGGGEPARLQEVLLVLDELTAEDAAESAR